MSTLVSQCILESLNECLGRDEYEIKFLTERNEKRKKLDKMIRPAPKKVSW